MYSNSTPLQVRRFWKELRMGLLSHTFNAVVVAMILAPLSVADDRPRVSTDPPKATNTSAIGYLPRTGAFGTENAPAL